MEMHYSVGRIQNEFVDADKPSYPIALPFGQPFEVVRTEVTGEGYDESGFRAVRFTHYVRVAT